MTSPLSAEVLGAFRATNLRVNDLPDPVGTPGSVFFGWHLKHTEPNQLQIKYQVLVASSQKNLDAGIGDVWDSGIVSSPMQNHIACPAPLASDTRYVWKVRYWDSRGNVTPYSESSSFHVGLTTNRDWAGAKWIRRDSDDADDYTYYLKSFPVSAGEIMRATLYISAVHKYELYLNGSLTGTGPSYHYPQFQYYNAYDITSGLVTKAQHTIALLHHWFGAGQGRPASARGVILKMIVEYVDGRRESIGTDGTWKQSRAGQWLPGMPNRNHEGVGYVEAIDAAKIIPDWYAPTFDDSGWSCATEIGAHPTEPWIGGLYPDLTRIVEHIITPRSITAAGKDSLVVDLGAVYAGRPRIEFPGGHAGRRITMRGGYTLGDEGSIDPNTTQDTDMTYQVHAAAIPYTWLPCEYLGMRYLEIENAPEPLSRDQVSFVVRHAALDESRSSFSSSNPTLNAVWDLCKRSVALGAQEQFLDTPTREKGGFLVDSMNESLAAMTAFGERVLTRKALQEFLQSMVQYWSDEQDRGRMNAVYPNGDGARDIPDFTQAYLVWVWEYYMQSGDKAFLRDNYPQLRSIADYVHRFRNQDTGLIHNLRGGGGAYEYGIVDWPPSMRYGYDMETSARTVVNCYAYADYEIVSRIAAELEMRDFEMYRSHAEELRAAINARLFSSENIYVDGLYGDGAPSAHASQQANMFPLALGIVPPEKRGTVLQHVKNLKMSSGMVTVHWLIRALGEMGQGEHLLELYTNPLWDGWAKNIAQGATRTWESWDADRGGNLSQSHPWGAIGLVGIQQYILGVKPLLPQYERLEIMPLGCGDKLTFASGRVPTERGDIFVRWEGQENRFELTVELPVNVEARVHLLCGNIPGAQLLVDGELVEGLMDGSFVRVDGIGSGAHTIACRSGA